MILFSETGKKKIMKQVIEYRDRVSRTMRWRQR